MDFIKKNKKYIIWAGCAIMAVAVFLTFVKASASGQSQTMKFIDISKDAKEMNVLPGWLVLIAAAAAAVLVYLKKEKFSLIATASALVITFYDYIKVSGDSSMKLLKSFGVKVSYVAPWIVLVGAIVAAAPVVIDILEEKGVIKSK